MRASRSTKSRDGLLPSFLAESVTNATVTNAMAPTTNVNIALWLTWTAYWIAAARSAPRGASLERSASRLVHLGAAIASLALLVTHPLQAAIPGGPIVAVVGDVVTGIGLAFAIWARIHLGQNWSGRLELKKGHRVVRSGPYGLVRHPIYAGIIMATAGSSLVAGQATAFLAPVIMLTAYLRKVRMEEAVLLRTFGAEYEAYRRDVKALVPFLV